MFFNIIKYSICKVNEEISCLSLITFSTFSEFDEHIFKQFEFIHHI